MRQVTAPKTWKGWRTALILSVVAGSCLYTLLFGFGAILFRGTHKNGQTKQEETYAFLTEETHIETMFLAKLAGDALSKTAGRKARMYVHRPSIDPWLSKDIAREGVYNRYATKTLFSILDALLQEGLHVQFLDVGANIGYYSLLATMYNSGIRTTAIEAHPRHARLLEKSLKLEENLRLVKRIQLYNVAVSGEQDVGDYKCMKIHPQNAAFTFIDGVVSSPESRDRLFGDSLRRFDLVKFSVQGYGIFSLLSQPHSVDIKAWRGARRLFSKNPPKVIIFDYNYGFLQSEVAPEQFLEELFSQWHYTTIHVEATGETIRSISALREFFKPSNFYQRLPTGKTLLYLSHINFRWSP